MNAVTEVKATSRDGERSVDLDVRQAAANTVYESCIALNRGAWGDFLTLCEPKAFRYQISNYSPEIKRTQVWMDQTYDQLAALFQLLPKHNSDRALLTRHVTVYRVVASEEGELAVHSEFVIYRTEWDAGDSHLESGATSLYVVGRYLDRMRLRQREARLVQRTVDLDTRQVGIGSHFIL